MNERIKQLAEQAVEETHQMMIMEFKNFESKLYEKFAELIVKECCQFGNSHNGEAGLWARYFIREIKEHFGVEE